MLLRSLARNTATPATVATMAADTGQGRDQAATAAEYLVALERIMVLENQPAWPTHLRSRSVLRSTPVRHLADPSLAAAALRARPGRLLRDLDFLGLLFESMVVRDLRVYAQATDADVFHYREKGGLEVDAIIQANDGRWAAFEVNWARAGRPGRPEPTEARGEGGPGTDGGASRTGRDHKQRLRIHAQGRRGGDPIGALGP